MRSKVKKKGGGGDPQVRLLSMRIISTLSYRATNYYSVRIIFFNRGGDTAGSQQKRLSCLLPFFAIMLLQSTTTSDPFSPGFVSAKYEVLMILTDGQAGSHACEQTGPEVFLPPVVCAHGVFSHTMVLGDLDRRAGSQSCFSADLPFPRSCIRYQIPLSLLDPTPTDATRGRGVCRKGSPSLPFWWLEGGLPPVSPIASLSGTVH